MPDAAGSMDGITKKQHFLVFFICVFLYASVRDGGGGMKEGKAGSDVAQGMEGFDSWLSGSWMMMKRLRNVVVMILCAKYL